MRKMIAFGFVICFVVILSFFLGFCLGNSLSEVTIKDKNNIDFYTAFIKLCDEAYCIPIDSLVPCNWDKMKVFSAYATVQEKEGYAGYRYDKDIGDGFYEDLVSILFLKDGEVVYFIDNVTPRSFEYKLLNSEVTLITDGVNCWNYINTEYMPGFQYWKVSSVQDEFEASEEPCLWIEKEQNCIVVEIS